MKPPMNQEVTYKAPSVDFNGDIITDDYGRYEMTESTSKARVQRKIKVIQGIDGQRYESNLEVDLPPSVQVEYGSELSYTDTFGKQTNGKVIAMEESTNLAGNRIYFRTVHIG